MMQDMKDQELAAKELAGRLDMVEARLYDLENARRGEVRALWTGVAKACGKQLPWLLEVLF